MAFCLHMAVLFQVDEVSERLVLNRKKKKRLLQSAFWIDSWPHRFAASGVAGQGLILDTVNVIYVFW